MGHLIIRRLLSLIPIVLGVTFLALLLIHFTEGDFLAAQKLQPEVSEEMIQRQREQFGLDQPLYVQYGRWLEALFPIKWNSHAEGFWNKIEFRIELGYSFAYRMDVIDIIASRLPATISLSIASLLIAWVIAIPLGVLAAIYKDSWFDRISALLSYVSLSVPDFFLALLALYFASVTGWFPVGGRTSVGHEFLSSWGKFWDIAHHMILPALILGTGGVAGLMRVMRANFLDVIRSEYVMTARAKGVPEGWVMFRHVFRNAINPLISMLGFAFSSLLGGALIVESVLAYPGLGNLMYQAILSQDQFVVMGALVISCVMLVIGNLLADIGLAVADPRIRTHG
jgi:peptide/nickel transport system permease protein